MASLPLERPVTIVTLPGTIPPMPAVARILGRYDRSQVEAFIAVAIDLLDVLDGEPDVEDDDPSGQCDEDEINTGNGVYYLHGSANDGAGCVISDGGI